MEKGVSQKSHPGCRLRLGARLLNIAPGRKWPFPSRRGDFSQKTLPAPRPTNFNKAVETVWAGFYNGKK
jgi:hypothetical protein